MTIWTKIKQGTERAGGARRAKRSSRRRGWSGRSFVDVLSAVCFLSLRRRWDEEVELLRTFWKTWNPRGRRAPRLPLRGFRLISSLRRPRPVCVEWRACAEGFEREKEKEIGGFDLSIILKIFDTVPRHYSRKTRIQSQALQMIYIPSNSLLPLARNISPKRDTKKKKKMFASVMAFTVHPFLI